MRPLSIRLRLMLWYSIVLAASFCVFGLVACLAMSASFRSTVDEDLRLRIQGVRQVIEQTAPEGPRELRDELNELATVRSEGDLIEVLGPQGQWAYRSTPLDRGDVGLPAWPTPAAFTFSLEGLPFRAMAAQVAVGGQSYGVLVAIAMHDFYAAESRFRLVLLFLAPLVLLLAALGGHWMSRRALAPVDEIIRTARDVGAQTLSQRLPVPGTRDELQRLTETLNEMLDRIESAFRTMARFTSDASHELRTPVALIRTSAETALRRQRSEAEYREALAQILAEAERTSGLVEQLLSLARADGRGEASPLAPTDLASCVRSACRKGRVLAAAKSLGFREEIDDRAVWVRGDAASLERLFMILIDNAVKYTPPRGSIGVSLRAEDGLARVEVRDTGIGIAASDLPRVFDRFYRADAARSRETGGAGLGLSIGRVIAEAHAGEIRIRSAPGRGSVFEVRLPAL